MESNFIERDDGLKLAVGDTVVARGDGDFDGLFGKIIDITDTKETGNPSGYDVHCAFEPPILRREQKKLEERFSDLYQKEMKLNDIALDEVIMDPEHLRPMQKSETMTIYVLKRYVERPNRDSQALAEDIMQMCSAAQQKVTVTCETNYHIYVNQFYTELDQARWDMHKVLRADEGEFLSTWRQEPGFYECELMENSYSAGVNNQGKYYSLSINSASIAVDELFAKKIAEKFPQ